MITIIVPYRDRPCRPPWQLEEIGRSLAQYGIFTFKRGVHFPIPIFISHRRAREQAIGLLLDRILPLPDLFRVSPILLTNIVDCLHPILFPA